RAHGQFLAARERTRKLEDGDIRTRDQEDTPNRDEKELKALAIVTHPGLKQSAGINRPASVRLRVTSAQFMGDVIEFSASVSQGHTGFESAEDGKAGMIIALEDTLFRAQIA